MDLGASVITDRINTVPEKSLCPLPHDPWNPVQAGLPGKEVPAKLLPVVFEDVLHALLSGGQNGEPGQDSPQSIFLTNVVGTCKAMRNLAFQEALSASPAVHRLLKQPRALPRTPTCERTCVFNKVAQS